MAGLADFFLKQATQPQNTGYLGAYNQGQQQAYGRGLSGALASGAPRAEVMSKASYVDPMGALKMQEAQANAQANQDPTKRKIRELEQLWKDANRSLTQAKRTGDSQSISMYEGLISKLTGQLEALAPDTWAGFGGETPIQTGMAVAPRDTKPAIDAKFAELEEILGGKNLKFPSIKADLSRWGLEQGIATTNPDYKVLEKLISDVEQAGEKKSKKVIEAQKVAHSQSMDKQRFAQSAKKDKISEDEKYGQTWNMKETLLATPNITNKRAGLNVMLRDESGAAIGADEFNNMMSFVLPDSIYQQFKGETQNIGVTLLGMASDTAREDYMKRVAEEYLNAVDAPKLAKYMDDSISTEYYKRSEVKKKPKKTAGTATETPNATNKEPFDQEAFLNRLKGMSN